MTPDVLTLTSFIALPAFLSFTFFVASFFMAVYQKGFKLPKGFLPSGVPVAVGPFLFVIEFISYFIRLFSLAIRLFINILAGHMLLKIFSTIILFTCVFIYEIAILQLILDFITIAFVFLEYAACLLQAIVLVSLVAIYIDHSLNFFH
jgi:F-type H+-transporting ATPase subunit a